MFFVVAVVEHPNIDFKLRTNNDPSLSNNPQMPEVFFFNWSVVAALEVLYSDRE